MLRRLGYLAVHLNLLISDYKYIVDSFTFFVQVDTAGWLQRTNQEKGPASLSIMQSRKNLMRAHIVALVLDAEEVRCTSRCLFSFLLPT